MMNTYIATDWTKDRPTVPGYYWCYHGFSLNPVDIWQMSDGRLFADPGAYECLDDPKVYAGAYWIGPIAVPEPPVPWADTA